MRANARSLHLRQRNGGVPLPASSLDLELPRSVFPVCSDLLGRLVDSTIFSNLLLPAPKKSYEIIKRKHKLPQKRRVFLETLPVEALYPGPLRQRHDALLLPEKKSKGKKLHELLQNATNALCLLLCLTLRLGQEQPMRSEIHSTCVCIHRGTVLTSL